MYFVKTKIPDATVHEKKQAQSLTSTWLSKEVDVVRLVMYKKYQDGVMYHVLNVESCGVVTQLHQP